MEKYFGNALAAVCGVSRRAIIEQTSDTADRSEESRKRLGLFTAKWSGGAFLFFIRHCFVHFMRTKPLSGENCCV